MTLNTIAREMAASWAEHHKKWHDQYLVKAEEAESRAKESQSWVVRMSARGTANAFRMMAADHLAQYYEKLQVAAGPYIGQLITNSCGILIQNK
ncbi:hypothetical protein [Chitinophaga sp. YIM B06452]|uniref:hypothetical protein n=1 Tax=Chitinophaga sp. YIM B06452 TaxID=3082158 RepID=UPI0031FEACD3